jgi:HK97 family phage major capsid protein
MKKSRELKEQRGQFHGELKALHSLAEKENRDLTTEEKSKWDDLAKKVEDLDAEIEAAEKREALLAKANAADTPGTQEFSPKDRRAMKNFSVAKAINDMRSGKKLTGLEKEISEQARSEYRGNDVLPDSALMIPSSMIKLCSHEERSEYLRAEKRALSATGGSSGSEGGTSVPTMVDTLIPALKPALVTATLGAMTMNGLSGNVKIPRNNNLINAAWETEVSDADEVSNTFDSVDLTPKRLAAWSKISWQLLAQSAEVSEAFVRAEIENAIARMLDSAAINGSGSSGQPTGILNTSGIGNIAMGTNGGVPSWANVVSLEGLVDGASALAGNLAYLTTPGLVAKLKTVEKSSQSAGQFIAVNANAGSEMNGYSIVKSALVPSNLTKGTSNACHALIFGNWAELIIAQWAGMYITVDDITLATNAQTKITINSWYDVGIRHAASFAAIKDALTA